MAGMLLSSPALVVDANAGVVSKAIVTGGAATGAAIGTWMAGPVGTVVGGFLGGVCSALGEIVTYKVFGWR